MRIRDKNDCMEGVNILLVAEISSERSNEIKKMLSLVKGGDVLILDAADEMDAARCLSRYKIDLIIIDFMASDIDGLKLLMILNDIPQFEGMPVIILGEQQSRIPSAVKELEKVTWDFMDKSVSSMDFIARADAMLRVKRLRDGLKEKTDKLEQAFSMIDTKGFYNKKYLFEYIEKKIDMANTENRMFGLVAFRVDNISDIKKIKGSMDDYFKQISNLFNNRLRGCDFVARYSESEFAIILHLKNADSMEIVKNRIKNMLCDLSCVNENLQNVQAEFTFGSSVFPSVGINSVDDMINKAFL